MARTPLLESRKNDARTRTRELAQARPVPPTIYATGVATPVPVGIVTALPVNTLSFQWALNGVWITGGNVMLSVPGYWEVVPTVFWPPGAGDREIFVNGGVVAAGPAAAAAIGTVHHGHTAFRVGATTPVAVAITVWHNAAGPLAPNVQSLKCVRVGD